MRTADLALQHVTLLERQINIDVRHVLFIFNEKS
jgi:hypothetical protein